MKLPCIIPARGGSKGIPGKNIAPLCGKPLIVWSIEAALAAEAVGRVFVSTDSRAIADVARRAGAEVIDRPAELASDTTPSEPVLLHALGHLREREAYEPELFVFMQCTSPLTLPEDIDEAVKILERTGADCMLSVASSKIEFLWRKTSDGRVEAINHDPSFRPRRQDVDPGLRETGALYVLRTAGFLKHKCLYFGKIVPYVLPRERSMQIDEPLDLVIAEALLRERPANRVSCRLDNSAAPSGQEEMTIGTRKIGPKHRPLVIAEIGINHEGSTEKAVRMIDDAAAVGCECVKFQCHVIEDEMLPTSILPANATESIWDIMTRCALSEEDEFYLKRYTEEKGMIYLSTPFSRAAAARLAKMGVVAFKIGSGECNNYPLVEHIANYGKPVILSTGMNDLASIERSYRIVKSKNVPICLLHCTSMYPTPYEAVRLGAIEEMRNYFNTDLIGLSDHSTGNYACLAAVALGACVLEKHLTSDKTWPGPDVPISIDPQELADLIRGAEAVHQARGGHKGLLEGEAPTSAFAYACVVSIETIKAGERLTAENIWVKRPGTGEILAEHYNDLLGQRARRSIEANQQLCWADIG